MNIETDSTEGYNDGSVIFRTKVGREALISDLPYAIFQEVVAQCAKEITKKVLDEKMTEILAKITPESIATMAMAEAGAAINETLHKKMPDKIIEVEKRNKEVWMKPFFGRPKRVG